MDAEVIPDCALEGNLLDCGRPEVAAGRGNAEFRRAVRERIEYELGGNFVGPAIGIDKLELIGFACVQRKLLQNRHRAIGLEEQRQNGLSLVLGNEPRGSNRLVQLQREVHARAFDRAQTASILDPFRRLRDVLRERQIHIRPFEPRVFEDSDVEITRALAGIFNVIDETP